MGAHIYPHSLWRETRAVRARFCGGVGDQLTDASHVRNAIARFDQVEGVSDAERDRAWKRIQAAAKKYDVDISVDDWRGLAHGGKS